MGKERTTIYLDNELKQKVNMKMLKESGSTNLSGLIEELLKKYVEEDKK